MISSIISIFGPMAAQFALALLNGILQKNQADVAAQNAYLMLTQAMAANGLISVSLHNSYADQQAANRAAAAAEYYRLHPEEKPVDYPTPPRAGA